MIALVQWALLVMGFTYFITESVIFAPIRVTCARGSTFRATLFYCPACMGFWVGVASGFLQPDLWVNPVQSGFAALALGRMWAELFPSNMFAVELPQLQLGEIEGPDDQKKEAQDV